MTTSSTEALYSLGVLQRIFIACGNQHTFSAACACHSWSTAARATHVWWLSLLQAAEQANAAGNRHFRDGDASEALRLYTEALGLLEQHRAWGAGSWSVATAAQLELICLANRSACHLRKGSADAAVADAAAATFDEWLGLAREALPSVATNAALCLMKAAMRSSSIAIQQRFCTPQRAVVAAVAEAQHLSRKGVTGKLFQEVKTAGARLEVGMNTRMFPLMYAIARGQLDRPLLLQMLDSRASINACDELGNSPLWLAVEATSKFGPGALQLLLEHGAWAGG